MKTNPTHKGILITGCSSGIGQTTALFLADRGYTVFATVRKEADAERLRLLNQSNLVPICPVDLTRLDALPELLQMVEHKLEERGLNGLFALINNAGGGQVAPIELLDLQDFHIELQTRILGSITLVQSFLPLIRQSCGRIIWIATPALIPTPYVSSIHACDFAINCIARTLDIELKPWKIANILIRCGGIKTPAGLRTAADVDNTLQRTSPDRRRLYEVILRKWSEDMVQFDLHRTDAEKVAQVVHKALMAKHPKHRYSVGYMASAAAFLEVLPQPIADIILKMRF